MNYADSKVDDELLRWCVALESRLTATQLLDATLRQILNT